MKLTEQLTDYINAAFTGIYINSAEPDEAEREIVQHAQEQNWRLAIWDIARGLRLPGTISSPEPRAGDPLAALNALPALAERDGTALLVLHHFQRFFTNPEVVQTTFNQLVAGKQQRTFLVIISPVVSIPTELEKLFVLIDHDLPDRDQLEAIAQGVATEDGELPEGFGIARLAKRHGYKKLQELLRKSILRAPVQYPVGLLRSTRNWVESTSGVWASTVVVTAWPTRIPSGPYL